MAKKSMIVKANRPQKYKVREYTRCSRWYVNIQDVLVAVVHTQL